MTPFLSAAVLQASSARARIHEEVPELTHDGQGRVLVTVGVTPTPLSREVVQAAAHFCSSGFRLLRLIKPGDGIPVRQDDDYVVQIGNGLWVPPAAGFYQFEATIIPNGCLTIATARSVAPLFLPVPTKLLKEAPWAHRCGRDEMAKAYGKRTLEQAFEAKGELLKI